MRKLNDWLQGYIQYTQHNEAPEHFHFWTGVGTISAALRRQCWLDQVYFEWVPNFYIILVADPGILQKSTTINIGKGLLSDISGIKFGPATLTWQSLIEQLGEATEMVQMPDGQLHTMSALSFFVSELGTLLDIDDRKMLDVLVDLWDGRKGSWDKSTVMKGRQAVSNPWMTIVAGTTPGWLADNLPRKLIGGGFTSRCVFVFGDKKRKMVAYPSRVIVPDTILDLKKKLTHDLEQIAMLKGPFELTEEAYAYGEQWYEAQYKKLLKLRKSAKELSSYFGRKQTMLHKLAMVLSAAKRDDLIISKQELYAAGLILDALEVDLPAVFRSITTVEPMEKACAVMDVVLQVGKIRKTELYHMFFHTLSNTQFVEAINSGVAAGIIKEVSYGNSVFIESLGKAGSSAGTAADSAFAPEDPSVEIPGLAPEPESSGSKPPQKS